EGVGRLRWGAGRQPALRGGMPAPAEGVSPRFVVFVWRSPMSERRVVVTGTGLITALGTGVEKSWQALINGQSGIGPITRFEVKNLDTTIAGEVKDFNGEEYGIERKEARRMDLFT